jgi:O-antigen ligase
MSSNSDGRVLDVATDAFFWLPIAILIGILVGAFSGWTVTSVKWLFLLVGAVGVLVTLARVDWALMCLVFITYINLSDTLNNYHNAPAAAKYYVMAVLALIFFRWIAKGERIGGNPVALLSLCAYALVSYLSAFVAENPVLVIEESTTFVKDAVIALVIMTLLINGASLRRVIWVLILSGLFLSAATIYQYITGTYPVAVAGFARADLELIAEGVEDSYRHAGPMDDANHFGQILVMILPLALERMMSERQWPLRALAGVAFVALLAAVLLTYSRGAVLSVLGMTGAFVFIYAREYLSFRNISLFLCGLLAVGVLIAHIAPQSYLDRINTMTSLLPQDQFARGGIVAENKVDIAVEGRLGEMKAAVHMFFDHPLTGVGYGNYELHYQQYELRLGLAPRHQKRAAHSLLLEIAAEQGLLGLGAFLLIVLVMFRCVFRAVRDFEAAGNTDWSRMAQALGFALLGYMIAAMFLHNSYSRYLWMLAGMIFALPKLAAEARRVRQSGRDASLPVPAAA